MLDPTLVREARTLIARASLIAEAPGADFVPSGKRAYESDQPSGNSDSTHDEFRRLFARANTDKQLERVIGEMRKELERLKTPAPPLDSKEIERRIVNDCMWKDASDVARWFDVSVKFVCDVRRRNGRLPATGEIREGATLQWASPEERKDRVRQLHAEEPDLSWRQIAERLEITHKTVLRDAVALGLRKPDSKAA